MTDIVQRLTAKDNLTSVINTCTCKPGRHPGELADLMKEAADEITRRRAENEKLRAALKPFADAVKDECSWKYDINVDDFRAAAAALKEGGDE